MNLGRRNRAPGASHGALRLALMVFFLAAAATLRLTHINWDQFQHVHPDERFIVWVADTLSAPNSLREALDPARSPINPFRWPPDAGDQAGRPRSYAYGHFPLYLLVLTAHAAQAFGEWLGQTTVALPAVFQPLNTVGRHLAEYNYLALVGRAISTLADLGTLLLVYVLAAGIFRRQVARRDVVRHGADAGATEDAAAGLSGLEADGDRRGGAWTGQAQGDERLKSSPPGGAGEGEQLKSSPPGGEVAGLLAAGAYAFAVLPIQLSHFYAVDQVLTFCVVATVALAAYCAERGRQRGWTWRSWLAWLAAGCMAGLAVGSKFSAVLLVAPLFVAALFGLPGGDRLRVARTGAAVLGRLAAALGVGLAVFVVTNPFAIIEPLAYISNILAQNAMVTGLMDAPYTRQYTGTVPYLYFVQQLSQWGLGWPLGIVAWGGLIWATARTGLRRASPALAVLMAWALPYFALTGSFHAKFLRYMAPLLPFLLIFGAGAALSAYRWLARRPPEGGPHRVGTATPGSLRPHRPRGMLLWGVVAAVVGASTVGWALAFMGIYRQDHPWIQASRWIYMNVPEGAKLLTEHWDDSLPLTMDEIPGRPPVRSYERVELPLWDADTAAKADRLAAELSSADYLIIASNRLYAPMRRLAARYPMSSQYYRMLWAGDLGYQQVAEFSAYPRLGTVTIPDDDADESFTVYDHPRVFIFANTGRLSQTLLRARLGRHLAQGAAEGMAGATARQPAARSPGHARYRLQTPAPDAPLTLAQPVDTLPVVADFRWNKFASEWPPAAVLLWWLALSAFGWAAWPLIFPLLGGLRDRGYGLARAVGWLLVGWVHWIGVSLGAWENRVAAVAALLGLLALLAALAWRARRPALAAFWAERRGLLLGEEALFAAAFLAFVGIRLLNPDLWQPWNGGEKFMESAFLNATLRSAHFPPYDPYFAGGTLNYYYYGLYLVSLPIKLTGIYPEVAFNLAVPGLFALTAVGLFSVGYSLAPRGREGRTGLLAVVLALLTGNLAGFAEWLRSLAALGGVVVDLSSGFGLPVLALLRGMGRALAGDPLPTYNYWWPSRVIPFSINEFPLWTFLFADLHPHLIAMPFGMVVVGLALNRWLSRMGGSPAAALSRFGLIILALGALGAINTWDLPTYSVLMIAVLVSAVLRDARGGERRLPNAPGRVVGRLIAAAGAGVAIVSLALVAYLPFYAHYQAQVGKGAEPLIRRYVGLVRGASPLGPWVVIWGFFLILALGFMLRGWVRRFPVTGDPLTGDPLTRKPLAQQPPDEGAGPTHEAEAERAVAPTESQILERAVPDDSQEAMVLPVAATESEPETRTGSGHGWLIGLLGIAALVALFVAMGKVTAALVAVPVVLAIVRALQPAVDTEEAFVALLVALGLGIVWATELVYLRDFLDGGDWYRMNTLFKFYVPAWLLMGLAGAVMLPAVWSALGRRSIWIAAPLQALIAMALIASLFFLFFGVPARVRDRFPGPEQPAVGTLDGTAFMTTGAYQWPDGNHTIELAYDYAAIHWMLDQITGTPVLAEAPAGVYEVAGQPMGFDYYRAGGQRAASFTGFPTFVGHHQYEQRPGDQVGPRLEVGQEFFRTTDLARGRELIAQLRVGYIYLGALERIVFPVDGLRKFDVLADLGDLEVVYRNPEVTIYRTTAAGR